MATNEPIGCIHLCTIYSMLCLQKKWFRTANKSRPNRPRGQEKARCSDKSEINLKLGQFQSSDVTVFSIHLKTRWAFSGNFRFASSSGTLLRLRVDHRTAKLKVSKLRDILRPAPPLQPPPSPQKRHLFGWFLQKLMPHLLDRGTCHVWHHSHYSDPKASLRRAEWKIAGAEAGYKKVQLLGTKKRPPVTLISRRIRTSHCNWCFTE